MNDALQQRPIHEVRAALGQRLRDHRLARNLTQQQVAKLAGVNRKAISGIERGNDASLDSFLSILRALDLLDRLDQLIPEVAVSPIAELEGASRPRRQRASSTAVPKPAQWVWGDENPAGDT